MYGYSDMHLCHHGIKGQQWGVKNGPPYPIQTRGGSIQRRPEFDMSIKNLKSAKMSNVDKWGKDAEHNCLYIVGLSGSGKSTTALGLTNPNDTVIHLDAYVDYSVDPEYIKAYQDEKFNKYLDKNVPNWRDIYKIGPESRAEDLWKLIDNFRDSIDSYSIQEFKKGNKVVAEGVQLADFEYLGIDDKWFNDRPTIILKPDKLKAIQRGERRDNDRGLVKAFVKDPKGFVQRLKWYDGWSKSMKTIEKTIHAKKGKKYVNDILETIGATKL